MTSTSEDIVRRATASFNAGRIDEARRLCEQELARTPGEPMLSHLLAAVLLTRQEIAAARFHIAASLARRPAHAAAQSQARRSCAQSGSRDAGKRRSGRGDAVLWNGLPAAATDVRLDRDGFDLRRARQVVARRSRAAACLNALSGRADRETACDRH